MNHIIYEFTTLFIFSFFLVFALTPFIRKFAEIIGFVDNPDARKVHKKATALMGGLSVFLGFMVLTIYELNISYYRFFESPNQLFSVRLIGYLGAAFVILIVGLIDDKWGMTPIIKTMGQFICCAIFLYTNILYSTINAPVHDWNTILTGTSFFGPNYITIPIMIIWMIGLMNALNFLDNMDGILAGMAGILAIGFYVVSFLTKTPSTGNINNFYGLLALVFAGSMFGFLPHNFNPAKIFLGDAGSMFIGYFLSTMGILTSKMTVNYMQNNVYYILPLIILSYAIFDISLVSITRKRDGRRITQGGKDHSTHRVCTAMGSTKVTALAIYLINAIIVLITIIILRVHSEALLVFCFILCMASFIYFGRKLDKIPIVVPKNQLKE